MSKPPLGNLINLAFSQTDDSPLALYKKSRLLNESSNRSRDFNIDLNKTYDLNKNDELLKASNAIKTALEPCNKFTFQCTEQKKIDPRNPLGGFDPLESDDSLGILPELLNDEMTCDFFKTELDFSDEKSHDDINPEINEDPASFVFSPPSDSQFNRISLFLKNISTPLPNFMADRRCSSTPKVLAPNQFNATDIIEHNSSHFLADEEPIAGSSYIKFDTDFDLTDLKKAKPLTSTCKAFSPPQIPSFLNESEVIGVKPGVKFQQRTETIESNLNVTQTFSNHAEDLIPFVSEDNIQNKILNNTFQIDQSHIKSSNSVASLRYSIPATMKISQPRSNIYSEKEKVKTLDSTFAIPNEEIVSNLDCEKTFVIDFNSVVNAELSPSGYKDRTLNKTHVLEVDSSEDSSKQQERIVNTTFTKDLDIETPISFENHFCSSRGVAFEPMKQILEETFSENNLNEIEAHSENYFQCNDRKSQSSEFSETFNMKTNLTFSEKDKILPKIKAVQIDGCLIDFASPNSPKGLVTLNKETREKICFSNENLVENETSLSYPVQTIDCASLSEQINKRINQETDKLYERDSMQNEKSNDLASSSLSKVIESVIESDGSKEDYFLETSVFLDSNDINKTSAQSLQPVLSRKILNPLDYNQSDDHYTGNNFSKAATDDISIISTCEETEFCTSSKLKEDCQLEILPKSLIASELALFSEKIDHTESDRISVSTENNQAQTSQNSLKEMTNTTHENTGDAKIEVNSLLTEKDKFETSLDSSKITNGPVSELADQDIKDLNEQDSQDRDSFDKKSSSHLTKLCLKDNISKQAVNQTSLKICSLESKTVVKGGLMKPTRIVYPIKVSECRNSQLPSTKPLGKPIVHKRLSSSDLNRTVNIFDNSTDKLYPEGFNRRVSLSCSSASDSNKPKCKNEFKKPFEIPLKLGLKRPGANFQKSRLDTKYSNGHSRNINPLNGKQHLLTRPDSISDNNPNTDKSIKVALSHKKGPISSKLRLPGKLPMNSLKMKDGGKASSSAVCTAEKKACKVASCLKVTDHPRKERLSETGMKTTNSGDNFLRHSIATNLPINTCSSKLVIGKQISAPASISCNRVSMKAPSRAMPPRRIVNPVSSLSKVQSLVKMSLGGAENKSVVDQRQASGHQNSKGSLTKPCIEGEAGQFVNTKIRTGLEKKKDNSREIARPNSSIVPASSGRYGLPSNASNVKKSNGQCNFLPAPKILNGGSKNMNSNGVPTVKNATFQNKVCRQTLGKLPQLRRIPSPRSNK